MNITDNEMAFLRKYQQKMEIKMRENEITVVQYWRDRLEKLISMKPEGIASLQLEMKKLSGMMENRMRLLKKELK
ncbi:MAG: hypothetical protein J7J07_03810 [Syntrophobacterales bacterium]|nr:hypothetical protein [Syntrophobacterales bacterium]OPX41553.1 MAG: hypothetical protein B1H13_01495 [Desulfobacteraceae bacterium 4484_190.3]